MVKIAAKGLRQITIAVLFCSWSSLFAENASVGVFRYDSENAPLQNLGGIWRFSCTDELPQTGEPGNLQHSISVPGTWRGMECPQGKLPGTGRHRYHLRIEGKMRPYGLAIFLPVAGTSLVAYWNGYKIHEAGNPAAGKPGYRQATVPIAFSEVNDLVIDVANFDDRYGGLWQAPTIGTLDELRTIRKYRFAFDGIVAGMLIFAALYNFGVFSGLRKWAYLYLGVFSLLLALRMLVENERIAHALLGQDYWYLLVRIAHLGIYLGSAGFFIYIKEFLAAKKWRWWEIVPFAVMLAYDLLVLFTPPVFFTEFLNTALAALFILVLITIYHTIRAVRKGRAGGRLILAGMILIFLATMNDIFFYFAFKGYFELGPAALVVFIFFNVINLEVAQYRVRQSLIGLGNKITTRRNAVMKLVPSLANRFLQSQSTANALLLAREKIPVRFAVLFADLRKFTTLTEEIGHQQTFNVINTYLNTVVPEIMREGGQVLEYQGDGILAFFPPGADNCLRAAIAMQQALQKAIDSGILPQLTMGIAMHTGSGELTLLGNYRRQEPVIISPSILEVQDLEALCSHYKVPYVLSQSCFEQLSRDLQQRCKILTDIAGQTIFTLLPEGL